MYVDDSGSPSMKDNSDYYVIAGVIVHETDIGTVENNTQLYKDTYSEFVHAEIHVHDIYNGQREFSGLTLPRKYELLGNLYGMINSLPITIIAVGIDKLELVTRYPDWDVFNAAWTFLTERFDKYITERSGGNRGLIIVDKSSKIPEGDIVRIVNRLRRFGSYYQPDIKNIVEEPMFIESKVREGIQVADACAYCTLKHLRGYVKFDRYWEIVHDKMRKGRNGNTIGFGFKIFPLIKASEDIRPSTLHRISSSNATRTAYVYVYIFQYKNYGVVILLHPKIRVQSG